MPQHTSLHRLAESAWVHQSGRLLTVAETLLHAQITTHLDYSALAPCTVLMQVTAAEGDDQLILDHQLDLGPHQNRMDIAGESGVGTRTWLDIDEALTVHYTAHVNVTRSAPVWQNLRTQPLNDLPADVVTYLMSSRYCPADDFLDFLPGAFDGLTGGPLINAMAEWVHQNLTYDIFASNQQTTARDTFVSRRGVCRDYAHLMVALARCSAIPARMVSAFGPDVTPPDFHAAAEVWLDGAWHMIDATGMATADRLIRIGVGRDAADVAFLTAFGVLSLNSQSVSVTATADNPTRLHIGAGELR